MVVKRLGNIWFSREKRQEKKIEEEEEEDKCNRLYHPLLLVMLCTSFGYYMPSQGQSPRPSIVFFFVFLFFYFFARLFPTFTAGYLRSN
jgi:hypothetical protein